MLRIRTILITALLMVGLTSLVPAAAGGPTSALLSVPGEARTASLYYTDADYEALSDLVGVGSATGVGTVDRSGHGPCNRTRGHRHLADPRRLARGGSTTSTSRGRALRGSRPSSSGETGSIWDNEAVWHQPRSGAELAALLDKLGVADAAREAGDFTGVAGAPVPAQNEPPAAEPAPAESSAPTESAATDASTGLWWGLVGLFVGVLVTALWMRPRRAKDADEDVADVEVHDDTGEPRAGVAEELSWPSSRS